MDSARAGNAEAPGAGARSGFASAICSARCPASPAMVSPAMVSGSRPTTASRASPRRSRHAASQLVIDLEEISARLARRWTPEQLAVSFCDASISERETRVSREPRARLVAVLATAIPPAATLNVALHTLHLLPQGTATSASQEWEFNDLLETAANDAADALHRRALELDGAAHGYNADEWLGTIC